MGSELLCEAIQTRTLLEFDYDGLRRVVAPYCHGFIASGEALRAVQLRGQSRSGVLGVGKLWVLAKMKNVRATGEAFVPDDPDYNPDDRAMVRIHCRIEPAALFT